MRTQQFPSKRQDGSFTVSARFSSAVQRVDKLATARISAWMRAKEEQRIDVMEDLSSPPRVLATREGIEVVFEARPGSRRWKDWMVAVSQDLAEGVHGLTFECFYDLSRK